MTSASAYRRCLKSRVVLFHHIRQFLLHADLVVRRVFLDHIFDASISFFQRQDRGPLFLPGFDFAAGQFELPHQRGELLFGQVRIADVGDRAVDEFQALRSVFSPAGGRLGRSRSAFPSGASRTSLLALFAPGRCRRVGNRCSFPDPRGGLRPRLRSFTCRIPPACWFSIIGRKVCSMSCSDCAR